MIYFSLEGKDLATLRHMPEALGKNLKSCVGWIAQKSVQIAKGKAPHDEGTLRRSLTWRDGEEGGTYFADVGANVPYAFYQEFGFKRHFVPFSIAPNLLRWARRHFSDTGTRLPEDEIASRGGLWVSKPLNESGYFLTPGINEAFRAADAKIMEVGNV